MFRKKNPRRRVQPPPALSHHIPAPMGGINAVDPASAMPATDAVYQYNLVPAEFGLRSRLGYREWCTNITGATDNLVRSILPFAGSKKNGSTNKLFACTSSGIWDVTASSQAPTKVVTFGITTGDAGWGISTVFVDATGGHMLLYTDEENGYYQYAESTGTWTKIAAGAGAGQISGVDPASFCFVMIWKNRVWFVQKDTGYAWYLPVNQYAGAASMVDFGVKFRAGGDLRGLYSWTYDGGSGIDDSLVGISGGGDVLIYQGIDPSTAGFFNQQGAWYIGGVPYGRNLATNFGGDLLLLSTLGLLPLSKLVTGITVETRTLYETNKVQNNFAASMYSGAGLHGWAARVHPQDNTLLIMVPQADGLPTQQLAMSLITRGWSQYPDLPMLCAETFGGQLYFGTADGRVCVNTDYVDNVTLLDPNSYTPVQWEVQTAFQNLGDARQKRVHGIRPTILSQSAQPTFTTKAKFLYDMSRLDAPPPSPGASSGAWDGATWDSTQWAGAYQTYQQMVGASGCGIEVAIAIRGSAVSRTVLVGFDVIYEEGSYL